jgi:hypothetical protein
MKDWPTHDYPGGNPMLHANADEADRSAAQSSDRDVEIIRECLDYIKDKIRREIGYLAVLDALGCCRLTLTEDATAASRAYAEAADLEKVLAES